MKKKRLYISEYYRKIGCTPENGYDPRYYDVSLIDDEGVVFVNADIIAELNYTFGDNRYEVINVDSIPCVYTEDTYVMEFMQDSSQYDMVSFESVDGEYSVAEELNNEGFVW